MQLLEIVEKCQHRSRDLAHEPFCLELFRRAIVEKDQGAWVYVHEQYFRLVYYWISRLDVPDAFLIEDLVQEAFLAFWRAYTPDKLVQAQGLGSVLAYLKDCAVSTVVQARRTAQKQRHEEDAWEKWWVRREPDKQTPDGDQVWQRIAERCQSEQELLVAQLSYLWGLKPRQIITQYPDRFSDVQEVYRLQRNLLERLRRDPVLNFMREKDEDIH